MKNIVTTSVDGILKRKHEIDKQNLNSSNVIYHYHHHIVNHSETCGVTVSILCIVVVMFVFMLGLIFYKYRAIFDDCLRCCSRFSANVIDESIEVSTNNQNQNSGTQRPTEASVNPSHFNQLSSTTRNCDEDIGEAIPMSVLSQAHHETNNEAETAVKFIGGDDESSNVSIVSHIAVGNFSSRAHSSGCLCSPSCSSWENECSYSNDDRLVNSKLFPLLKNCPRDVITTCGTCDRGISLDVNIGSESDLSHNKNVIRPPCRCEDDSCSSSEHLTRLLGYPRQKLQEIDGSESPTYPHPPSLASDMSTEPRHVNRTANSWETAPPGTNDERTLEWDNYQPGFRKLTEYWV